MLASFLVKWGRGSGKVFPSAALGWDQKAAAGRLFPGPVN